MSKNRNIINLNASGIGATQDASRRLSVTAESANGKAVIRIVGRISDWSANNATELGVKIDEFIAAKINDVFVYINSSGGDVFQANEIVNLISKFTGKKDGEGGAIVASAATRIAISLDTFEMAPNGQWMYHKPKASFDGDENQVESSLQVLKNATNEYRTAYANKTGLAETEIEKRWTKGDVWLSAAEAKKQKFITGIKGEDAEVTDDIVTELRACGAPFIPLLTVAAKPVTQPLQQQNQYKMEFIALLLGLPKDATEAQITAKINQLKVDAEAGATLTANASLAAKAKLKADIKELLDNAIQKHTIKPELRADYEKALENDFEGQKRIIEVLTPIPQLSAHITTPTAGNEDRSKWTYADWADKDPEGLKAMNETDFPKFEALMNAEYATK